MSTITTRAAIARAPHVGWEITNLQLDDPKAHEVRVKIMAAGLCHSDDHITTGDAPIRLPVVGGHEGAGIVESVGPDVQRVKPGDKIVCSYIPACGACRPCSTGHSNMCVKGLNAGTGMFEDGTWRFHEGDTDIGGFCTLGTFSQYAVVSENACVKVDREIPLRVVALVSCGVLTGWGSVVNTAQTQIGETVVVVGAGGIGLNAVQGARLAGASTIVAVDPVESKRDLALRLGATHAAATAKEAGKLAAEANPVPRGADAVILAVGNLTTEAVTGAFRATGKGGILVIAGLSHDPLDLNVQVPGTVLAVTQRRIAGSFFGSCNPIKDVPLLLRLYQRGELLLDQLVSKHYALEEVSAGYADLAAGRNARGVIEY